MAYDGIIGSNHAYLLEKSVKMVRREKVRCLEW
jgi:hypothetical protein